MKDADKIKFFLVLLFFVVYLGNHILLCLRLTSAVFKDHTWHNLRLTYGSRMEGGLAACKAKTYPLSKSSVVGGDV